VFEFEAQEEKETVCVCARARAREEGDREMSTGVLPMGCLGAVRCQTSGAERSAAVPKRRILVMGGTGRVGGSTLRALATVPDLHLIVAGRNRYFSIPHLFFIGFLQHHP
jgi:hypothetical protein